MGLTLPFGLSTPKTSKPLRLKAAAKHALSQQSSTHSNDEKVVRGINNGISSVGLAFGKAGRCGTTLIWAAELSVTEGSAMSEIISGSPISETSLGVSLTSSLIGHVSLTEFSATICVASSPAASSHLFGQLVRGCFCLHPGVQHMCRPREHQSPPATDDSGHCPRFHFWHKMSRPMRVQQPSRPGMRYAESNLPLPLPFCGPLPNLGGPRPLPPLPPLLFTGVDAILCLFLCLLLELCSSSSPGALYLRLPLPE